jgi:hypothetical protein
VTTSLLSLTKNDPAYLHAGALTAKENAVAFVQKEAAGKDYAVFVYCGAIYQYDYSYLFYWGGKKDVYYDPGAIPAGNSIVYLIIPPENQDKEQDFINYHTPQKQYVTAKRSVMQSGIIVIRREKKVI